MKKYSIIVILLLFFISSCHMSRDRKTSENSHLEQVSEKYIEAGEKGVDFSKVIPQAIDVRYKLDKSFEGSSYDGIIYLGVFKNNEICALDKGGIVSIINPEGKMIHSFIVNPKNGKPSAVAIDQNDLINVFISLTETEVSKVRGKIHNIVKPIGVECLVFNKEGHQIEKFTLPSLLSSFGARFVNDKIVVTDGVQEAVGIFDCKTKKLERLLTGFRACRGVLDLCINIKQEILVANNAVFQIKAFDLEGNYLYSFGERGKTINDFRGCCNPMSVDCLSNGAIATIEKDPSRIKIYSKNGAKLIAGTDEIIKGYKHLPMIINHKDQLYFAMPDKGLFRCVGF